VSIATDDELREAGTNYDSFITDHYMQLPPTLPQRVRELALELTEDAETPFDKAMAIQEYMRSEEFTYSQDIEAPPAQADGVDHFLFETQTGYSDYFGSSMAVLLRAAGVPARMAAGFAPGEYVPVEGKWAVRDSDSHGWVQAYFPRYGWIDFEPTPSWAPHERRILDTPAPGGLPDRITGASETEEGFFAFPIEDEDAFLNGFGGETVAPTTNYMGIVVRAGIAVGTLAAIWLVFYTVWNMALVNASPVERAFTKMTRLGAFAGVPKQSHHTPDEYGRLLAASVPESADRINDIASAYSGLRYSGKTEISRDEDRFERFWKSIRSRLIVHGIRRFLPFLGV
jgi:hypothetical protein